MNYTKPELAAPSGNWSSLYSAIEAGADAVYFSVKDLNMRMGADNFDMLEMKELMQTLHKKGKKGYLALNTIVFNREMNKIKGILEQAAKSEVDAIILWDMSVFSLAKELGLPVHLSTQASVSNFAALKFYVSLGIQRIVLARECALSDIKDMAARIVEE